MHGRATVLTDASHHPQSKVGGYGYWIISDRGSKGGGAHFKKRFDDINQGEMQAIVNALVIGLREKIIMPGDIVLVQSDSTAAISRLTYQVHKNHRPDLDKIHQYYKGLCADYDLYVNFKHVRGHSGKKDKRSISNKLCDKRAKQAMRAAHDHFLEHGELPDADPH